MARSTEQLIGSRENEIVQVVTFVLGDEVFAFPLSHVREIIRMGDITRVPKCPDYLIGVFNLRGNIMPVIDLRRRFAREVAQYCSSTRIIVVEIGSVMAGFVVDAVLETRDIPLHCIEAPPAILLAGIENEYIPGVAKVEDRLLILLDIAKILE